MKKLMALAVCLAALLFGAAALGETFEAYGLTLDTQDTLLDLGRTQVKDFEEFKSVLRRMPQLTQCDMYNTRMEPDVMEALTQEFPEIRFGWTLRLGPYRVRTDATAFSTLRSPDDKPRYKTKTFEPLKYCYQLRALDLGHNAIEDISFVAQIKTLRYLILADNDVVDLTPLEELPELEYIELFMNNLVDLSPLEKIESLIDLNLCQMTLEDVSPLYRMTNLKRLWISRRKPAFTEEEMNALRQALPGCEINFTAASCTGEGWRQHPRFYPVKNSFRKDQVYIEWTDAERSYTGEYPYADWKK